MTKNGSGTLYLQGSSGNTYTGSTTITGGKMYLNKTSGYAIPGNLTMSTPTDTPRDLDCCPGDLCHRSGRKPNCPVMPVVVHQLQRRQLCPL